MIKITQYDQQKALFIKTHLSTVEKSKSHKTVTTLLLSQRIQKFWIQSQEVSDLAEILKNANQMMNQSLLCSAQSHYVHHQCFMATVEDTSDSDSDSDSNCDDDDDDDDDDEEEEEEFMLELRKLKKKVRTTVFEMMKRVMVQDQVTKEDSQKER